MPARSSASAILPPEEPIECEVLAVDAERSIRFSWRDAEARRDGLDSTVTFEIAATEAGGTHLTIVHEVRHARRRTPATMAANDNRPGHAARRLTT